MNKEWVWRLRRWLIEPAIIGYAGAGFLLIHVLSGDPAEALAPGRLQELGLPDSANAIAFKIALAVSFFRAIHDGLMIEFRRRFNPKEKEADDDCN